MSGGPSHLGALLVEATILQTSLNESNAFGAAYGQLCGNMQAHTEGSMLLGMLLAPQVLRLTDRLALREVQPVALQLPATPWLGVKSGHHQRYTRVSRGGPLIDSAGLEKLLDIHDLFQARSGTIKLSGPNRLGVGDLPPWPEVVPLARALIGASPDRMLWATDWPHPNKFVEQPNDADLLEQLESWAPDEEMRRRILVDNPTALYGF